MDLTMLSSPIEFRHRVKKSISQSTLLASIETLPQVHNSKYHGIHCGSHLSRHYCIWCPYAKQPFVSTEFHKDGEGAKEFMNRNSDLYTRMSEVLEAIFPSVSRATK